MRSTYGNVRQNNVRVLYVRYREKNNVRTVRTVVPYVLSYLAAHIGMS